MNNPMKLGQILPCLDKSALVKLWQTDVYLEPKNEDAELIFDGYIMDIPWVYLDFYLINDENNEAIDVGNYGENKYGFVILICEDIKRLND